MPPTANPQQVHSITTSRTTSCTTNKSTTNRISGVWALTDVHRNCYRPTVLHCTDDRELFIAHQQSSIDSRYSSKIAIFAYTACIRRSIRGDRRNIAITFGTGKTRMVWLPDGENFWIYAYSFRQNTRTWRTDTRQRTLHRHRPRLCIWNCSRQII